MAFTYPAVSRKICQNFAVPARVTSSGGYKWQGDDD